MSTSKTKVVNTKPLGRHLLVGLAFVIGLFAATAVPASAAVTATFAGGTLSVFGDGASNTIDITRCAAGRILVNGGAVTVRGGTATVTNTALGPGLRPGGNDTLTLDEANGALPRARPFGGPDDVHSRTMREVRAPSRRLRAGGRGWQDLLRSEVQQATRSGVLAVRLHDDGLKVEEIATPSPDTGEVLVRVHAAAITRSELEWPVDRLPATPSHELSGVVVGSGDEVYALTPFDRDGVAAEYAVVPADLLAPKPLRLSHVEAAALPMGGLTAWQALFVHGRLARGERVLVTGASGGVGHIAVQLARHAGAAVVESGPVDLVFDTRGGEVPAGERVVTIAEEMPGAIYFIVEPDHEQLLELRTLVDAGELRAEVDSVFPLTEAGAAFERVAGRGKRGKVVLEVGSD
jgi:hypothetical protein